MTVETIVPLAMSLGAKFFASFLVGMFGSWAITRSVYIGLAGGTAVGFLVTLAFP